MPFPATVFKVMIASPGDVPEYRDQFRHVVHEWNATHAESTGRMLLPTGWETDATPAIGAPQDVINKQLLEDCDLLVAVFGSRIGSPTENFPSGTIEEISRHIKSGKPAMVYFSEGDLPHDVDTKQLEALRAFRSEFEKKEALTNSFTTPGDFASKFGKHLAKTVNTAPYFRKPPSVVEITPDDLLPQATIMLRELAQDQFGSLMIISNEATTTYNCNGKVLNSDTEPRTLAEWRAALEQLRERGLISDVGEKGMTFELTDPGFRAADQLSDSADDEGPSQSRIATQLTPKARELLLEASMDHNGQIMVIHRMQTRGLQTHGKFLHGNDPRSQAEWKAALDQLCELSLAEFVGNSSDVFAITELGFKVTDELDKQGE